jgi:hypothetical protein
VQKLNLQTCKKQATNNMKRFIFLSITLFCLSSVAENIQAAVTFPDGTDPDPVWDDDYCIYRDGGDDVVTDEDELRAAFEAATTGRRHIIPIANDITLTLPIIITRYNLIVLRKSENGVQKPWDFKQPWTDTNAASPDLYDGEPDYFIRMEKNYPHFIFDVFSYRY